MGEEGRPAALTAETNTLKRRVMQLPERHPSVGIDTAHTGHYFAAAPSLDRGGKEAMSSPHWAEE